MTAANPAPEPSASWVARDHGEMAARLGAERAASESDAVERLARILGIVWRLRDDDGCPWDRSQTVESMAANLAEEAHEAVDAIASGDDAHIAEELGDVLMNVLLIARIAEQQQRFTIRDVAGGIAEKLVRRHPHVFGDGDADDPDAALASWNASKRAERDGPTSVLGAVPGGLPALLAALKIGRRAADVGFDWPDVASVFDKVDEERRELSEAWAAHEAAGGAPDAPTRDALEDELGDLLFAVVNVARKADLDPELALRRTIHKFRRRFASIEAELGAGLSDAPLDVMEALWRRAADAESDPGGDAASA